MRVLVLLQKLHEKWAGRDQDNFVSFNLLTIFTGQGAICELSGIPQLLERGGDIFLEVVPLETEPF